MSASRTKVAAEKPAEAGEKSALEIDAAELELRVHIAELRARQVEAEIRLVNAMAQRRQLKEENLRAFKKFKLHHRRKHEKGAQLPEDDGN